MSQSRISSPKFLLTKNPEQQKKPWNDEMLVKIPLLYLKVPRSNFPQTMLLLSSTQMDEWNQSMVYFPTWQDVGKYCP